MNLESGKMVNLNWLAAGSIVWYTLVGEVGEGEAHPFKVGEKERGYYRKLYWLSSTGAEDGSFIRVDFESQVRLVLGEESLTR